MTVLAIFALALCLAFGYALVAYLDNAPILDEDGAMHRVVFQNQYSGEYCYSDVLATSAAEAAAKATGPATDWVLRDITLATE